MSDSKKKTPAEELMESLMKDIGDADFSLSDEQDDDKGVSLDEDASSTEIAGLIHHEDGEDQKTSAFLSAMESTYSDEEQSSEFESTRHAYEGTDNNLSLSLDEGDNNNLFAALGAMQAQDNLDKINQSQDSGSPSFLADSHSVVKEIQFDNLGSDVAPTTVDVKLEDDLETRIDNNFNSNLEENLETKLDASLDANSDSDTELVDRPVVNKAKSGLLAVSDSEKTIAVAGYQTRSDSNYEDRVKVSVGQNRASTGYQSWSSGGGAESNLAQAENLRIAQEKILELEKENEKLRSQNEELIAASEIIKERSDLLSSQLNEYKNDRDGLEDSYKSEIVLLKNHLAKKDAEVQKAQLKIEELDSRLKFDMKKIRIRERELENRLELVRAEKNAIVKNKDEQILDLRRKMDILQMEVESYRQKCVELNKSIESSQESFKRTTRALRLAMANLELQDENKPALKKVD